MITVFLKRSLRQIVALIARYLPTLKCKRLGIRYEVDLKEVIDFNIFFYKWEPETVGFITNNTEKFKTIIEVGGNSGAHTLLLAKHLNKTGTATVHTFEPSAYAREKLYRNLSLNNQLRSKIIVNPQICGSKSQIIAEKKVRSSWSSSGTGQVVKDETLVNYPVISLDDYGKSMKIDQIDLIKIDVDGAELDVLSGLKDTLRKQQPVIYIEINNLSAEHVIAVYTYLSGFDYRIYSLENSDASSGPLDLNGIETKLGSASHRNFVCTPKGKRDIYPI